ncbi:ParB/RepB/Spo0J family partition protein [Agromyces sp. H3Y2-19a]|jgi:ParB family chromosome partitioning protein|uniref:ParB/RepB/Spo0J family partition protein n=1 Tax=Agromyces TaxID=33877 RepID=UPI001E2BA020|nr:MULTISPECIES: ParB/RepB/Spo0J family partition protein [Agromyces]MCD5345425.1 ParB/RepB/Spo0J family partition protein [Agromyces sp. S2-1-8]MDF0515371.1 ParB/RepB/Spo0J family partition protein [Agromyces chromiiresistens]
MASKRTGLGRGIGALIPTVDESTRANRPVDVFFPDADSTPATAVAAVEQAASAEELVTVPGARLARLDPNDIVPNAVQPRSVFDPDDLAELVHSVREFGVLQPIVVRPHPDQPGKYELVMGERRLRATKAAGLDTIPAVVKDTANEDMLRDALLENLHRSQLNPLEEASAYQQLLADFGITQEELANRIGRSRPQISNTLRLLKLPEPVQLRVAAGVLTAGHARAILSVGDAAEMQRFADKIVNEELSVRAAESIASQEPKAAARVKPSAGKRQDFLDDLATRLGDRLNTRVKIALGARKGQISIDFATVQDLRRILTELGEELDGV